MPSDVPSAATQHASAEPTETYIRFQSPTVNEHGRHHGIFALANRLAATGSLSETEHRWWRASNDWFNEELTNPATIDPELFRHVPGPLSWFNCSAEEHLRRASAYLELLTKHGVPCDTVTTNAPGTIVYRDDHQILATPRHEPGSAQKLTADDRRAAYGDPSPEP